MGSGSYTSAWSKLPVLRVLLAISNDAPGTALLLRHKKPTAPCHVLNANNLPMRIDKAGSEPMFDIHKINC